MTDDVTNVELRAVAGLTYPLVEGKYKPDAAVEAISQGITPLPFRSQSTFPYVATPHDGFDFPSSTNRDTSQCTTTLIPTTITASRTTRATPTAATPRPSCSIWAGTSGR